MRPEILRRLSRIVLSPIARQRNGAAGRTPSSGAPAEACRHFQTDCCLPDRRIWVAPGAGGLAEWLVTPGQREGFVRAMRELQPSVFQRPPEPSQGRVDLETATEQCVEVHY